MLASAKDQGGGKRLRGGSVMLGFRATWPLTQEPGQGPHALAPPDPRSSFADEKWHHRIKKPFLTPPIPAASRAQGVHLLPSSSLPGSPSSLTWTPHQLLTGFFGSSLALVTIHFPHSSQSGFSFFFPL